MSSETISLPTAISDLYPFQQNRIRLSCGYEMSYVDKGEGHPVLMIHGNPTWSFFYRELIKTLRPRFRSIDQDHIGC
ncbi:MAG: alpha/beta hydrolase, partial [Opitutales bacterium]|nr:alpha/beta hydrolase [Opitutales bacterium]